jgi:hypothetical protein
MGLDGKVGVKELPALHVDVSALDLLRHIDWFIFARGEIRKGRWGLLGDGFYADLSASGDLGGVLYRSGSGSLNLQQGRASLALAYRIIDDRRGFLDLYAGARYNYLGVQISTTVDSDGVCALNNQITDRLATSINEKATQIVGANAGILASELEAQIKQELDDRALAKIAATPTDIWQLVPDKELLPIYNPNRGAIADYISAEAAL